MDALLFTITLEVALLQLKILETGANKRTSLRATCEDKTVKHKQDKLARDRKLVIDKIKRTLLELAENGEWCVVKHAVESFKNKEFFLALLKTKNETLKLAIEDINADLMNCRQNMSIEIENYNQNISILRDKLKESVYNTTVQLKYADKYLNARSESLEMKLQVKTVSVPRVAHENCVHKELLQAYELQICEKETLLDFWQAKYTHDIKDINERLKQQREKFQVTESRRKQLEELYTLHQGEMRGWLTFKRERAARLAREERARKAATRMQAWWRGVMVRRCLGQYRILKNPKKGVPKPKKK